MVRRMSSALDPLGEGELACRMSRHRFDPQERVARILRSKVGLEPIAIDFITAPSAPHRDPFSLEEFCIPAYFFFDFGLLLFLIGSGGSSATPVLFTHTPGAISLISPGFTRSSVSIQFSPGNFDVCAFLDRFGFIVLLRLREL
jgi:hypothetical protein